MLGSVFGTRALRVAAAGGVPALVVIVYANLSDLAIRNFSTPSLLQPMILLLALVVWRFRSEAGAAFVLTQPLTVALAAYAFVLFLSSTWANEVRLADVQTEEAVKSLAIFFIVAVLVVSWGTLRRAFAALVVTAALLGAITIVQFSTGAETELGGLASRDTGSIYGNVHEPRAAGPVGDPNFFGQLLIIVVPLGAAMAATDRRPPLRVAYGAMTLAIIGGLLFTYSRGALIALMGMGAFLLFALRRQPRYLVGAAAAGLLALVIAPENVTRRLLTIEELLPGHQAVAETDASIEKRKLLMSAAAGMFADHPIVGVGAGNFARHYARYAYRSGSAARQYEEPGQTELPHVLYLEIAAETGLLGLAVFGGAIAAAFVALHRARRRLLARGDWKDAAMATALQLALCGYLFTSLFLHGAFQRNLWILLALAVALSKVTDGATALAEPVEVQR